MVYRKANTVHFDGPFREEWVDAFLMCLDEALVQGYLDIKLDFSRTTLAWPDSMVPVLTASDWLKRNDGTVTIALPLDDAMRKLFLNTSWAHYLQPDWYTASAVMVDHFNARRFQTATEQQRVVNDVMRLVVAKAMPPKDVLTGFEWSLNEITDNVLTHASSPDGGIVQVTSLENGLILCVGDAGRGILSTLKEGHPELRNDEQALGEAVKAGVTRDPKIGQGNGLAGTLRVATLSGGAFRIASYRGRLSVRGAAATHSLRPHRANFPGTLVKALIRTQNGFDVEKALEFSGGKTTHLNILDFHDEEGQAMVLRLASETDGFGSRYSGKYVREKCLHLLATEPTRLLILDWAGVPLISSSFADEALGKLFVEIGPLEFGARIRHQSMERLNVGLVNKAILQRASQQILAQRAAARSWAREGHADQTGDRQQQPSRRRRRHRRGARPQNG
jgi:anti-sigma regulatory factor (Ser/Thr protein kinase)